MPIEKRRKVLTSDNLRFPNTITVAIITHPILATSVRIKSNRSTRRSIEQQTDCPILTKGAGLALFQS